jgi:hypothetical protein
VVCVTRFSLDVASGPSGKSSKGGKGAKRGGGAKKGAAKRGAGDAVASFSAIDTGGAHGTGIEIATDNVASIAGPTDVASIAGPTDVASIAEPTDVADSTGVLRATDPAHVHGNSAQSTASDPKGGTTVATISAPNPNPADPAAAALSHTVVHATQVPQDLLATGLSAAAAPWGDGNPTVGAPSCVSVAAAASELVVGTANGWIVFVPAHPAPSDADPGATDASAAMVCGSPRSAHAHTRGVTCVAVARSRADRQLVIASGCVDGAVAVHCVSIDAGDVHSDAQLTALHRLAGHGANVSSIAFAAEPRWLATGSHDRTAQVLCDGHPYYIYIYLAI